MIKFSKLYWQKYNFKFHYFCIYLQYAEDGTCPGQNEKRQGSTKEIDPAFLYPIKCSTLLPESNLALEKPGN